MKFWSYLFLWALPAISLLTSCNGSGPEMLSYGIKKELADFRKDNIENLTYQLSFSIPESKEEPITGFEKVRFDFKNEVVDFILDFDVPEEHVKLVKANGEEIDAQWENNHLVISGSLLQTSENEIEIDFIAGDQSLNRQEDYLYTLFVPARASTCFPVIDQPDLKASYELTLSIPEEWEAISNSAEAAIQKSAGVKKITFEPTLAISSYLFAFAVGDFDIITRDTHYGKVRMFHRESDSTKLDHNVEAIFDWHLKSLDWLTDYTTIEYPFPKFDFILLPSFQYGGMEHPGAVFYKASSLLLDESPTINQEIGRGRLIAHETAHMWFGDLVTMPWFDDVWLKEVFANFMAAKIINPSFPSIDHDLKFILGHYPNAYSVDRTEGTHAIAQELDDLYNAGSLYGSIIYQKAPIVMRKLEQQIGETSLKEGLRNYLKTNEYGNASWDELIEILSKSSGQDLTRWNKTWVKKKGMPVMVTNVKTSGEELKRITLVQVNEHANIWQQHYKMEFGNDSLSVRQYKSIDFKDRVYNFTPDSLFLPTYVFPNMDGDAYGYFKMGRDSKKYYSNAVRNIDSPISRAALWMGLYENMLNENMATESFFDAMISALPMEKEPLIIEYLNGLVRTVFWKFLSENQRLEYAPKLEGLLFNLALSAEEASSRSSFFKTFYKIAITKEGLNMLQDIWADKAEVEQIAISENDKINMAYELTVKLDNDSILMAQIEKVTNSDRKKKMMFISGALSSQVNKRDAFFESLKVETNRQNEDWVLEGLQYLHHPCRQMESQKYIRPSLELLQEIKATGDIFFPKRWLDNTLGGHQSATTADAVRQFLYRNHDYPKDLKNKILQSSDMLFRAERILSLKSGDS